jgi:hypothetical protein
VRRDQPVVLKVSQMNPLLQSVPPQQGWPPKPQLHTLPALQTRFGLQSSPGWQQGWPRWPHVQRLSAPHTSAGGSQAGLAGQQGWL